MPSGYKIDVIPKSMTIVMPDKSIIFRRVIGEQEGAIIVNYTIDYKKAIYLRDEYPDLHAYFKK